MKIVQIPPPTERQPASISELNIEDDWVLVHLLMDVPIGADTPKDVLWTGVYLKIDGINLVEARFTPPPGFHPETPSPEWAEQAEHPVQSVHEQELGSDEVTGLGPRSPGFKLPFE